MADHLTTSPDTPESPRKVLWGAPVAIVLTFLMVGCYTILKHPITSGEAPERAQHQEFYRDQCLDCHEDYATYPYGFFYGDIPEYYFEYPRWGYYYAYPWWWDHYWYEEGDDSKTAITGEDALRSRMKADRRGSLAPPYIDGSRSVITNFGGTRTGPSTITTKGEPARGAESAAPTTSSGKTKVQRPRDADAADSSDVTPTTSRGKARRRGGVKP